MSKDLSPNTKRLKESLPPCPHTVKQELKYQGSFQKNSSFTLNKKALNRHLLDLTLNAINY